MDSYAEHGIEFWLLSEGNEVAMGYYLGQQQGLGTAGWPVNDRHFVKEYLGPHLRASNHSHVRYAVLDDQRVFARYYLDKVGNRHGDLRKEKHIKLSFTTYKEHV